MTDTIKHFEQQTLQFLVLSCILFIQKSSSVFQSCDRSNMTTQEKKKKKKKTHLGQVFRSVTSSSLET